MNSQYQNHIAIIGAGISGLSAAYHLLKQGMKPIVFEKGTYAGGHAETLDVVLEQNGKKLIRFVDMGVNDYNKDSYVNINKIFKEIGYEGLPIEDSTSFSTLDGDFTYTTDHSIATKPPLHVKHEIERFQRRAYETVINPKYRYYTVEQYAKEKGFSEDFIFNNLYARINGMYFCNGNPGLMPIRAVMNYYILQEGYKPNSLPTPDRRYFVGGTRKWIKLLIQHLNKLAGYEVVKLNTSVKIPVPLHERKNPVLSIYGERHIFHKIIIATPADSAIHLFEKGSMIPPEIVSVLTRFQYASATVVAHTSTSVLQPNYNSSRTYNIHIYDFKHWQIGPYTISYVINRHQNDAANPRYMNHCQNPQYFVSVNPHRFPPETCILKTPQGEPAIRKYKHQILNFDLMDAQEKYLPQIQGRYGIYYCNGYGKGAGLHDQCWLFGEEIAQEVKQSVMPKELLKAA